MNSQNIATLTEYAKSFYNTEQLEFSTELFNELELLKLEPKSKITAFLINAPIKVEQIKKSISDKFSKDIVESIELLNRIGKISFTGGQKNIIGLRKLFIELTDDISIIIIKLAERLIKLRWADRLQEDNVNELAEECLYFYSPIAQMLGIRKLCNEMEDIAFKNLFPKDFEFLQKEISEKSQIYNSKLTGMRNELTKVLTSNKIPFRVQSRIKRPYSIHRKLKTKKITLESIFDLLALRVITNSVESCYLTLGIVHSRWVPIDGRFKDWISYPKANGYRSIQTTVHTRTGDKFEIQIRTEEMHQEAEYGSSAHWAYKQNAETQQEHWIHYLRDFLENDEYFENPVSFFDFLKSEMKRDYINVLTPKGEIRSLPEGSTPVDYGFAVHTDLGSKITGARVNGKFVKLRTTLKSGDVIEVMTSPNATPSRDWLNFVKTTRARSKIIRWFKKNEKELYILQGKNTWEKLTEQYKKKLRGFEDEKKLKANLAKMGFKTMEDFYYAISSRSVKCSFFFAEKVIPRSI